MNQITEWLQQIIAIIILAGFLEMLLPNNELRNVTKMIMGLLIITILIQPLIKVFDLPQNVLWSLPTFTESEASPSTGQIIKQGLKIRDNWTVQFNQRNKTILAGKIKNMIGLIDEIQLQDVELTSNGSYLTKATLKITPLDIRSMDGLLKRKINQKIRDSIQLVTNLTEGQIEVIWNGGI